MTSKLYAELVGTCALLAIITGSGVMGESLSEGNAAVALLANSIATGAGLYVLISTIGPISGAHFNPLVSCIMWKCGWLEKKEVIPYCVAQIVGAILGV